MSSRNKRYSCKWGWLRNFAMILKLDCSMQSRVLRCSLEFSKKFSGRQLCSVSFCQLRYLQTLFKPCTSATHSIPVSFGRCSSAVKGTSWLRRFAKVLIPQSDKQVTTNDLKKFLTENSIRFEEGYTCLVIDCQLCHRHGHRYGNPGKLFINRTTGMFLCLKCQSCGSWQDLQDYLSLLKMGEKKLPAFKKLPEWLPSEDEIESLQSMYNTAKSLSDFDSEELQEIFQNFAIQNLSPSILEKYDVRIKTGLSQLLFPIYAVDGKMVGLQVMNAEKVSAMESVPRNLIGVLFGWKQLNAFKHSDTVVIAGSPFDVLAIAQEVNVPVVSLPQEKYLPLEVLPLFEPYHKVIFWLGNNMASWELAKMLARKLNDRRCFIIRPQEDHPTPLEALRLKLDISKILKTAHAIAHKAITTFHTLRQDVFSEICHTEQVAGVKWKRYPLLTRLLKGHRHGELTVFTGPTGSGKTTFMSEYSLDLCMQGIRTLWGSFEIRNSRLAKMMLTQFALISLDKHLDQYDYWADKFEQLPLYFMTFHGSQSIRSVLDAMRHAVYVHDIEHVIVDNLQFMMGTSETSSPSYAFDRFWRQDIIVSSFRQFATVHNCHVTLVIHPRKENSDELNNMSIFGGAKASQEADNVLILQDRRLSSLRGRKYIQVTKNRYDGELGICPLDFDRETLSYALKKKPRKSSKLNIPIAPETTSESDDSKPVGS